MTEKYSVKAPGMATVSVQLIIASESSHISPLRKPSSQRARTGAAGRAEIMITPAGGAITLVNTTFGGGMQGIHSFT